MALNSTQLSKAIYSILSVFADELNTILQDNPASVCLYGSCALGDFREGWSDIDFIALTDRPLSRKDAEKILELRQRLVEKYGNPLFRSLEGVILSHGALLNDRKEPIIYWGTSGQRITDRFHFDSIGKKSLREHGIMICGEDFREDIPKPAYGQLYADVLRHCETIRKYAGTTGAQIYSFGWLLDIARCIYTLRTGEIIAKTAAGEWALQNNICPEREVMETTVAVRKNPLKYLQDESILKAAANLGLDIQRFADVLEAELRRKARCLG